MPEAAAPWLRTCAVTVIHCPAAGAAGSSVMFSTTRSGISGGPTVTLIGP